MSLREEIIGAAARFEPFEAFGKKCTIRILSGRERDQVLSLFKSAGETKSDNGVREKLVALYLGDATGARVFDDKDIELIEKLDGVELQRIFQKGWELNRFAAGSLEDTKKG